MKSCKTREPSPLPPPAPWDHPKSQSPTLHGRHTTGRPQVLECYPDAPLRAMLSGFQAPPLRRTCRAEETLTEAE